MNEYFVKYRAVKMAGGSVSLSIPGSKMGAKRVRVRHHSINHTICVFTDGTLVRGEHIWCR